MLNAATIYGRPFFLLHIILENRVVWGKVYIALGVQAKCCSLVHILNISVAYRG